MNKQFYHPELLQTPEGVRDIYGNECAMKQSLLDSINSVIKSYGFHSIQTPSFEFFDIFNKERGTVAANEMYKFFDRDNNTLVLRPDITPSIARSVAKYYENESFQVRLCYNGNTYINNTSYQGKLKEITQAGAELINDDTSDADAEMIAMTVETLLKSGLKEFQIDVGHAEFFGGLAEAAGLDPLQIKDIKKLLEDKNEFAIEQYVNECDIPEDVRDIICKLPEMFGNIDYIDKALQSVTNERALAALDRLKKLYTIIDGYGFADYVNVDLGMVSRYNYYTGIIFRAYTYGTGEPVATGGRYDELLSQFGKDGSAIGVAINVDQLMLAMLRQKLAIAYDNDVTMLLYIPYMRTLATGIASKLRNNGSSVQMMRKSSRTGLEEYIAYADRFGITELLFVENETTVTCINPSNGEKTSNDVQDILKGSMR